jgi:hypothetical protein
MKYIITESHIDKLLNDYIDGLFPEMYIVKDGVDGYVWSSKESWGNSERPVFSYYGITQEFGVLPSLIIELSSFFPLEYEESMDRLKNWFETKFDVPVKSTYIM